jgi:hypothetical protein
MITLGAALAAAAVAESRTPNLRVTAEAVAPEMTLISGLTLTHAVHRFAAGDTYFLATAYDVATCTTIYYNKMTGTDASDWNAGWTSLVGSLTAGHAYCHDLFVSGQDAIVCYRTAAGIYARETANGGTTWTAAALVSNHGGANDIVSCAILNQNTVYFVTSGNVMFRATRSGGVWTSGADWDYSDFWTFIEAGEKHVQHQIHARQLANGHHAIVFNGRKGDTATFTSATIIAVAYYISDYGFVRPALGHDVVDFDYWHLLHGLSAEVNGYFFGLVAERYIEKADPSMAAPDDAIELQLARTKDLVSWHLIPTDIYVSSAGSYAQDAEHCYTAGVVVNGSAVCLALSRTAVASNAYTTPASSWWGETPTEVAVPVTEDVQLSEATQSATKTEIKLNNAEGDYSAHATIRAGSIVRIYGGYNAAEQQRFTGPIVSLGRGVGHDKTISFTVMDMLWRATAIKQAWPHILKGQNVLAVDFADEMNVDYFVAQGGSWRASGGYYEQYERGQNALALAGYDPGSAHLVRVKLRFTNEITNHKAGIIVHASVLEAATNTAFGVIYNDVTNKLEVVSIDTSGEAAADPVVLATSVSSFVWTADTDYWLMARIQYGRIDAWTSLNGTSWTLAVSADATSGLLGPHGYPGLYAYIDDGTAVEPLVRFDDVWVFSAESYQTGSDVMEYLAGIAGIDTDERKEIEDTFSSTFSSRWAADTSGTWSVSGGYAQAVSDGATPALKLSDISTADIVVKCDLVVNSADSGLVVRSTASGGDCYAATISTTAAKIRKRSSGTWSDLCSVPGTFSGAAELAFVARGPYLSLYVDGILRSMAHDTELQSAGLVGMYSLALAGTPSQHDTFEVQAWYKPVDVVSIRPEDTVGSVMAQLAALYTNGHFFCNYQGDLTYGVFDGTTVDLDVRATTLEMSIAERSDQVLTNVRSVGANAFGEVRDRAWAIRLLGHRYANVQANAAPTGNICYDFANDEMDKSQRVTEAQVTIRGYPGIELCDTIGIAETVTGTQLPRRVLSYSETIGSIYEQAFDGLAPIVGENPPT